MNINSVGAKPIVTPVGGAIAGTQGVDGQIAVDGLRRHEFHLRRAAEQRLRTRQWDSTTPKATTRPQRKPARSRARAMHSVMAAAQAQLKAKGVPQAVIGEIARSKGAAPGGPNYHKGGKRK
jgi:hypothetical protein